MLTYAAEHPLTLLVRPHFRLFTDLPASPAGAALLDRLQRAEQDLGAVVIDRSTDYLAAFRTADALVSDASSLISEFVPTGKPVLYLHKTDGPGVNEDAQYFHHLDVATQWPQLADFLDSVRSGVDSRAGDRRQIIAQEFPHVDGKAGQRIAAELLSALAAETEPARGAA